VGGGGGDQSEADFLKDFLHGGQLNPHSVQHARKRDQVNISCKTRKGLARSARQNSASGGPLKGFWES